MSFTKMGVHTEVPKPYLLGYLKGLRQSYISSHLHTKMEFTWKLCTHLPTQSLHALVNTSTEAFLTALFTTEIKLTVYKMHARSLEPQSWHLCISLSYWECLWGFRVAIIDGLSCNVKIVLHDANSSFNLLVN